MAVPLRRWYGNGEREDGLLVDGASSDESREERFRRLVAVEVSGAGAAERGSSSAGEAAESAAARAGTLSRVSSGADLVAGVGSAVVGVRGVVEARDDTGGRVLAGRVEVGASY